MAPLSPHLAEMEEKRQHLPPHALPLCRLFLSRLPLSLSLSPSLICLLALLPPLLPLCYSLPPKVSREGRGWGLPAPGFNSFLALSRLSPSRSAWVLGAAWGALLAPLEVQEVPAGVVVGWKQPQAPCQELRAALAPSPRHLHPGTHGCAAPCATGTERSWAGCPRRVPAALSIMVLQVRGGVTASAAPLSPPCPVLSKGEGVWEPWGGGRAPQPPARARCLCPSPKRGQILTGMSPTPKEPAQGLGLLLAVLQRAKGGGFVATGPRGHRCCGEMGLSSRHCRCLGLDAVSIWGAVWHIQSCPEIIFLCHNTVTRALLARFWTSIKPQFLSKSPFSCKSPPQRTPRCRTRVLLAARSHLRGSTTKTPTAGETEARGRAACCPHGTTQFSSFGVQFGAQVSP